MEERIVYLNGAFVPESQAKVSVLDSGFNAGDGVYDVTRTFRHKPFRLREHTERLFRSLQIHTHRLRHVPRRNGKDDLGSPRAQQTTPTRERRLRALASRQPRRALGRRQSGGRRRYRDGLFRDRQFSGVCELLCRGRAAGYPIDAPHTARMPRVQSQDHQQNEPQHGILRGQAGRPAGDPADARYRWQP